MTDTSAPTNAYVMPRDRAGEEIAGKLFPAEATCVPGLIIVKIDEEYSLTHAPSGLAVIAAPYIPRTTLRWIAGALSGLPIVWVAPDPVCLYQQVSKFSDDQLETFFILVKGYRPTGEFLSAFKLRDPVEWLEKEKARVGAR